MILVFIMHKPAILGAQMIESCNFLSLLQAPARERVSIVVVFAFQEWFDRARAASERSKQMAQESGRIRNNTSLIKQKIAASDLATLNKVSSRTTSCAYRQNRRAFAHLKPYFWCHPSISSCLDVNDDNVYVAIFPISDRQNVCNSKTVDDR